MKEYVSLIFLALSFLLPMLFRKKGGKRPIPSPELRREPPFYLPIPPKEMPLVDDIPFESIPKTELERAPIQEKSVIKDKCRKNKIRNLLKELPSKKEIFILSEILKKPSE